MLADFMKSLIVALSLLFLVCAVAAQQPVEGKTEFAFQRKEIAKEYAELTKAAKSNDGRCAECHRELQKFCERWALTKAGERDARDWIKAAYSEGALEQVDEAKHDLGSVLLNQLSSAGGFNPKAKEAAEAERIYAELIAADEHDANARFDRGRALAFQARYAEASAQFRSYLSASPQDERRKKLALRFETNPELAAHRLMPSLQIMTSTGKLFNNSALYGDVIVLDFWASWCAPCLESVQDLKQALAPLAGRRYIVISISIDTDRKKWSDAMSRHGMIWPQAIDDDWRVKSLLSVNTIPHFLLIDADGLVLYEGAQVSKMGPLLKPALDAADIEAGSPHGDLKRR